MPLLCLRRAIPCTRPATPCHAHALLCSCRAQRCGQELCSALALPRHATASPCSANALLRCAPAMQGYEVLSRRNAMDCGAKPSHIGSVPPNANAARTLLCRRAVLQCNALAVLSRAHPLPCVSCPFFADAHKRRALPSRCAAEPCCAIAALLAAMRTCALLPRAYASPCRCSAEQH